MANARQALKTSADLLREESLQITSLLTEFLEVSSIHYAPQNRSSSIVWVGWSEYHWNELDSNGRRLQGQIRSRYGHFVSLMRVFLQDAVESERKRFEEEARTIQNVIDREDHCWYKNTVDALSAAQKSLASQVKMLGDLYDPREGEVLLVPDTNALLYSPHLERWCCDEVPKFTIVLTPTVLSELDALKIRHPQESVRETAQSLIRRFKEYRRRAREAKTSLFEGVPLKTGRSRIAAVAREPDFSKTLPWLDKANNDDRILATFLEVLRSHPHSAAVLVTGDFNLQSKAELASVPYLEPPEDGRNAAPKRGSSRKRKPASGTASKRSATNSDLSTPA
jgi:hypothetical protein